jgi:hypothetical protein
MDRNQTLDLKVWVRSSSRVREVEKGPQALQWQMQEMQWGLRLC